VVISFLIFGLTGFSQPIKITLLDSLMGEFSNFDVDNFGNLFTTQSDVVVKYSPKLDTLFSGSLKTIIPTSIESSKSFRVLVFDKERGVIDFMDNTLTAVNGEIDLADLDVLQASVVAESFNGNAFWVLDEGSLQLLKIGKNFEVITRIDNLNFLFENKSSPIQMFEKNDELIIHFPNHGFAVFDVFGTFIKYHNHKSQFIYVYNDLLLSLNTNTIDVIAFPFLDKITSINLPIKNGISFKIKNQKLYLKSKSGLRIFSIQQVANNK
jgi:hypothetical protein